MLTKRVSLVLTFMLFVCHPILVYAASSCTQEKVDKLFDAGLSKDQVLSVCPQVECTTKKVEDLKRAGLNDCEIDQICPGHFSGKVDELKTAGLNDTDIARLFPGCMVTTKLDEQPDDNTLTPHSPEDVVSSGSDDMSEMFISDCSDCSSGNGRLDVEIVAGENHAFKDGISTLVNVVTGSWYKANVYINGEMIGEKDSVNANNVIISKMVPPGKHEVRILISKKELLLLGVKKEYKTTVNISEARTSKLQLYLKALFPVDNSDVMPESSVDR